MKRLISLFFSWAIFLCLGGNFSFTEESFPFIGRVAGARVNVRASASEDAEVLIQLNRGDLVTVLSEENGWLKIEPPKGTTFWVHSKMLKDGWVKTDGVNVRSGPGTHYAAVCQVNKETSIDVVEQKGDWVRILPPLNSSVWVNKELVRYFSAPQDYLVKLEEEKEADRKFQEAEAFRTLELRQEMKEIDFDAVLAKYREIVDRYPESKEFEKARSRLADTEAKKEVALREIEAAEMRAKRAAVRIPTMAKPEPIAPPATVGKPVVKPTTTSSKKMQVDEEADDSLQSFVGKLKKIRTPTDTPFDYQLMGGFLDTRRLCYLTPADNLSLSSYLGRKVRVTGHFVSEEKSGVAAIRVERIEQVR